MHLNYVNYNSSKSNIKLLTCTLFLLNIYTSKNKKKLIIDHKSVFIINNFIKDKTNNLIRLKINGYFLK